MKATEDTGTGESWDSEVTVEQLYNYGPEKLRSNNFTLRGTKHAFPQYTEVGNLDPGILGDSNIVLFFTKKVSDNENDLLHNSSGPASIFNRGEKDEVYYFLDGVQVDPSSKGFRAAIATMTYTANVTAAGCEADLRGRLKNTRFLNFNLY